MPRCLYMSLKYSSRDEALWRLLVGFHTTWFWSQVPRWRHHPETTVHGSRKLAKSVRYRHVVIHQEFNLFSYEINLFKRKITNIEECYMLK